MGFFDVGKVHFFDVGHFVCAVLFLSHQFLWNIEANAFIRFAPVDLELVEFRRLGFSIRSINAEGFVTGLIADMLFEISLGHLLHFRDEA